MPRLPLHPTDEDTEAVARPRPRGRPRRQPPVETEDALCTADAPLPREQALREFYGISTGKEPPVGCLGRDEFDEIEISESLIHKLGAIGLATITSLALRGHFKAAEFLASKCIGELRKPFGEAVQNMPLDEAEQLLYVEYTQTLRLSPEVARRMVEAAKKATGPVPEEVRRATAGGQLTLPGKAKP